MEDVEQLMEETQEAVEKQREISDLISGQLTQVCDLLTHMLISDLLISSQSIQDRVLFRSDYPFFELSSCQLSMDCSVFEIATTSPVTFSYKFFVHIAYSSIM